MKRPVYTGLDKTEFGTSPFPVFFQKGIIFFFSCFQKTQHLFYSDRDVTKEKRNKQCSFYKTYSKINGIQGTKPYKYVYF
jgi:hypothetical protein